MPNGYGNAVNYLSGQQGQRGQPAQPTQRGGGPNPGLPGMTMMPHMTKQIYSPAFQIPYYQQSRQNLQDLTAQYQGRGPSSFRGGQQDLIDMLSAQARGEGPTVAGKQLQAGSDRNLRQLMAATASQQGGQPGAAAQRGYLAQAGQAGQELASQASQLRAQEMMSSRGQLADALNQARQQDLMLNQLNDQMVRQFVGQGMDLDMAQAKSNMALQQMLSANQMAQNQIDAGIFTGLQSAQEAAGASRFGTIVGGLTSLFSDRALKRDVVEAEDDMHDFLDSLGEQ